MKSTNLKEKIIEILRKVNFTSSDTHFTKKYYSLYADQILELFAEEKTCPYCGKIPHLDKCAFSGKPEAGDKDILEEQPPKIEELTNLNADIIKIREGWAEDSEYCQDQITTEIVNPNFQGTHMSTDVWQCICGKWRKADEKCIHLKHNNKIIDSRKENI
jgi:hypothetical protein